MNGNGFDELRARLGEISDLGRARALLEWDEHTQMPLGGAEARAEQVATLARVRHERATAAELGRLLERLAGEVKGLDPASDEASLVRVASREFEKAQRVPAELRAEIARTTSIAQQAWVGARERSDFPAFLTHLQRVVELVHRYVECFAPYEHPYDPLLDDYEPGMRIAGLRPILERLRSGLTPLIAAIAERAGEVDDGILRGEFEPETQQALARELIEMLPLNPNEWRLDVTVHPFATAIAPSDVRITNRYEHDYIGAGIFGALHESGHAIYDNGYPRELARTPLCRGASLGLHESQSRLWENWVGRSRPFSERLLKLLAKHFPSRFGAVGAEQLYRAVNKVSPSLIRVEADEVTYNLHIAIRFELEVEIVEGRLDLRDLPEAWNSRYSEYLGVEVPDDARGVLQDVHWSAGSFGYFPTYSLGNVIGAQLWDAARAEMPDLNEQITAWRFGGLLAFLRERVHRHGFKQMPAELIEQAVGGPLDTEPLLTHLNDKFGALYGL